MVSVVGICLLQTTYDGFDQRIRDIIRPSSRSLNIAQSHRHRKTSWTPKLGTRRGSWVIASYQVYLVERSLCVLTLKYPTHIQFVTINAITPLVQEFWFFFFWNFYANIVWKKNAFNGWKREDWGIAVAIKCLGQPWHEASTRKSFTG